MKASRILAGMSAAAFAASMLSMVSASAATEIVASDFGTQIYVMGIGNWNWQSEDKNFTEDGTINISANAEDLMKRSVVDDKDNQVGGTGVQFYLGDAAKDLADNEYTTETIEYTITASGDADFKKEGKLELELGKKGADGKRVSTTEIELVGYGKEWEEYTKLGDITVQATITDIKVVEEEPSEEDYSLPYSPAENKEYAAWGDQGYISSKVYQNIPEGKGATVSIEYNVKNTPDDNGGIYRLAKLALADGWGAAYDAGIQDKYDEAVEDAGEDSDYAKGLKAQLWKGTSITDGFPAEKSLDEDEVTKRKAANAGDPSLNADGFFVFYYADDYTDKGTLTFHLSPECVKAFAAENETGYGGSLFQVWNIDITKVTVDVAEDEPVKPTEGFTAWEMFGDGAEWFGNWNPADKGGHGDDVVVTADQTDYTVSFTSTQWFDEDGKEQWGNAPEGTEYKKLVGTNVWCVDIEGLADAVGAGTNGVKNDDGSDLTNEEKQKLAIDAGIDVTNVHLLVDGKEVATIPDDQIYFADHEGNGKLRIEIYNPGGKGETANPESKYYVKEVEDAANAIDGASTVAVSFSITGIPEEAPPAQPVYEFAPAEGVENEYTVKTGEKLELGVLLTQDGKAVKDENVNWVFTTEEYKTNVEKTGESEGEVVVIPTDESGISTAYYTAGSESKIVTVVATLENAEDYGDVEPVVFTIYQNAPESQDPSSAPESSSSSSSSNSSNGGNSSSAPASDNNPATGAAALGTVGLLLAGAAMAVSKKKH